MKYISLTKGFSAMVDDEDVLLVSRYSWRIKDTNKTGLHYAITGQWNKLTKTYKTILMHRMILGFPSTLREIDHIDHDGLNNQKANIRVVTHSENLKNRRAHDDIIFFKKHGHKRDHKDTSVTGTQS